jgi:hypothetical protein
MAIAPPGAPAMTAVTDSGGAGFSQGLERLLLDQLEQVSF